MKLVKKLILAAVLTMAVAPVIGVANDPTPDCNPCPDIVLQAH